LTSDSLPVSFPEPLRWEAWIGIDDARVRRHPQVIAHIPLHRLSQNTQKEQLRKVYGAFRYGSRNRNVIV